MGLSSRVVEARAYRVVLKMRRKHSAAAGSQSHRELILVNLGFDNGRSSWAECPTLTDPSYQPETTDVAWRNLTLDLLPETIRVGKPPLGMSMAHGALADAAMPNIPSVTIPGVFGWVIGLGGWADTLRAAHEANQAAMWVVKIRPGSAAETLSRLRSEFPDRRMAADANASFELAEPEHVAELQQLDSLGLEFIETPVRSIEESAELATRIQTPIALDEVVASAGQLDWARELEAGSIWTVKPSRLGGLEAASTAISQAYDAGWRIHLGGMLESAVGRRLLRTLVGEHDLAAPPMVAPTMWLFDDDPLGDDLVEGRLVTGHTELDGDALANTAIEMFEVRT